MTEGQSTRILAGTRFGSLTALEYVGQPRSRWKCSCDCGEANCRKILIVDSSNLRHRRSKSCGCKRSPKGTEFLERVKRKISINEHGCWVWPTIKGRYAYSCMGNKHTLVHRKTWELLKGPIPDGLCVLHNCPGGDNSFCVNPDHMFLGTRRDNSEDRDRKNRTAWGESHGSSKLTAKEVVEIFEEFWTKRPPQAFLADRYGISRTVIGEIVSRKSWHRTTEEIARKLGVSNESTSLDFRRSSSAPGASVAG